MGVPKLVHNIESNTPKDSVPNLTFLKEDTGLLG